MTPDWMDAAYASVRRNASRKGPLRLSVFEDLDEAAHGWYVAWPCGDPIPGLSAQETLDHRMLDEGLRACLLAQATESMPPELAARLGIQAIVSREGGAKRLMLSVETLFGATAHLHPSGLFTRLEKAREKTLGILAPKGPRRCAVQLAWGETSAEWHGRAENEDAAIDSAIAAGIAAQILLGSPPAPETLRIFSARCETRFSGLDAAAHLARARS